MARKKNHFVDNKQLLEEFIKYRSKPEVQDFLRRKAEHNERRARGEDIGRWDEIPPQLPDSIGKAIFIIAKNFAMRRNWAHIHCIEDMIGDAIIYCTSYIYNFNPEKSNNPFAYITQTVRRGFLQRIDKEKAEEELKTETIRRMSSGQSDSYVGSGEFFVPSHVIGAVQVIDEVEEMNKLYGVRGSSKNAKAEKAKKESGAELVGF